MKKLCQKKAEDFCALGNTVLPCQIWEQNPGIELPPNATGQNLTGSLHRSCTGHNAAARPLPAPRAGNCGRTQSFLAAKKAKDTKIYSW